MDRHRNLIVARRKCTSRSRRSHLTIGSCFVVMLIFGLTGVWVGAVGTTRYVDDNTCPQTGSGTLANPYCHIQDAVCVAVSGDTVSVAPGTYPEAVRMRPGVSLISQGGAAVTTINAAGKPCTQGGGTDPNPFCAKRTGNQCSVVTFALGHTTSTVLDGFTLTGGAGLPQNSTWVAGGGIFVFSSPTIINNIITNNVLTGPSPENRDLRGAGVYVAKGAPIISNNTITGNRAVPAAGASGSVTFGYGGGLWLSPYAEPVVTNNIITGNRAGDPNAAYSLGVGAGVVSFPPGATYPAGHKVDRNFIADNLADNQGGGVALESDPTTEFAAVVTNNVIVGNSAKNGGGVYEYFCQARIVNNTITGNTGFFGGGVYLGQGDVAFPVTLTNNIIEGNFLSSSAGTGGGIYKLDLDAAFEPNIGFNDIWSNQKNNVAGDRTDADTIGVNGNISLDPRFVNKGARNFHLDPNSPAIDRATTSNAPPVDKDNQPRGVDGNGVPNNPSPGDIDVGAFEFLTGGCVAETCDGADNNCNTLVDEGFPNFDGDPQADCVDPDDDNDLAADVSDCSPLNATAFGFPADVAGLDVTAAAPTTIPFTTQAIGSGTRYEMVAGLLSRLRTVGFQESFCAASLVNASPWQDPRPAPPPGEGWYYLIRATNACGAGTLGSTARDAVGAGDACPNGIVDGDADGSPSDLDCNDANPALSPLQPELCDNIDNNCNLAVDEGNPGGGAACGSFEGECRQGVTQCTAQGVVCAGGVGPAPELCDGLDNDCDGTPDNNVVDTDHDGQNDCVDGDDDNDTVADGADCAPLNAGAFAAPAEVSDVDVLAGAPTPITWATQTLGSATSYDVATGLLSAASGTLSFSAGSCLGVDGAPPFTDSRGAPPAGQAYYYMVKARNACGPGTYGTMARDTAPACP